MAHTYQLGAFPKQYLTMLPRGLQQNKALISLYVIVISYSVEKATWLLGVESGVVQRKSNSQKKTVVYTKHLRGRGILPQLLLFYIYSTYRYTSYVFFLMADCVSLAADVSQ